MDKKKILLVAGSVLVLAGLVFAGWFYFFKEKPAPAGSEEELTNEKITESLTAPAQSETVPSEAESAAIVEGLTAPSDNPEALEVTDELLDSLSAPAGE